MSFKKWIKDKLELYKDDFEFRLESLILDITESISKKMIERKINRSKLAELLDVSPPAVTKILNGNSNFTLKTLLSLSDALDVDLKVEFKEKGPRAVECYWDAFVVGHFDVAEASEIFVSGATEYPTHFEIKKESYFYKGSYDLDPPEKARPLYPGKLPRWEEAA